MSQSINYSLKRYPIDDQPLYIDHETKVSKKISNYIHKKTTAVKAYVDAIREARREAAQRDDVLREQLRNAGLSRFDMMRAETHHLSDVLFADETITAAVCGWTKDGTSTLMLVTNVRIVCVNQIPLFVDTDEFAYSTVSGVSVESGRLGVTISLNAAIGTFTVRTTNRIAAKRFVDSVEKVVIESQSMRMPVQEP